MKRPRRERGMTLIEIGVVMALIAMLFGIALPSLNSLTGANTRAAVSKLASNIKATRGHAAVSGQTCRIVFDLDEQHYWAECTEGMFQVAFERELRGQRSGRDDEELDADQIARLSERERTRYELKRRTAFAARPFLPPQSLDGALIDSVWVQHQEDFYSKGRAYLYFFPSGLGEQAAIHLRRGEDTWFSLHVAPLSGRVQIFGEKTDLPKMRWEDS